MQRIMMKSRPFLMKSSINQTSLHLSTISSSSYAKQSYTDRQAKLGRPVSPHVTIYRFPIAAITSIMIRVTGVALSAGITGIGAVALVGGNVPALAAYIGGISIVGPVAKLAVGFPLVYHYLGAVRHAVWDKIPESTLTTEEVTKASYLLLGSSIVVSAGLAMVSI